MKKTSRWSKAKEKKLFIEERRKHQPNQLFLVFVFVSTLSPVEKNWRNKISKNRKIFLRTVNSWFSTFTLTESNVNLSLLDHSQSHGNQSSNHHKITRKYQFNENFFFSFFLSFDFVLFCFLMKRYKAKCTLNASFKR